MLMNDSRECAQAANAALATPPVQEKKTLFGNRQVEKHARCFLFGHYDSRGGASLIPAKNLIEAFKLYSSSFGFSVDEKGELQDEGMRDHFAKGGHVHDDSTATYEAWLPNAIHTLLDEDYMFSCEVLVCDQPFFGNEDGGELDSRYAGKAGYRYGVVQYRWKTEEGFTTWTNLATSSGGKKTLVFWKGKEKPVADVKALGMDYLPGLEVRILRRSYGEDACGVCWQTEAC